MMKIKILMHLYKNSPFLPHRNMKSPRDSRRDFLKKTITGTAVFSVGGILPAFSPKSYGNILGANERIKVSVMGVNSRGNALPQNFATQPNAEVIHICDVDQLAPEKCINSVYNKRVRWFLCLTGHFERSSH